MFKLFVFAAVLAVASAGIIGSPFAYSALTPAATFAHAPLAYAAAPAYAAPIAYSAPVAAQVAVPAPVTYTTGYKVINNVEPVEQHGYKIVY